MTNQINAQTVRENYPGYVGGTKIAKKATDTEIYFLVNMQDMAAKAYNQALEYKARAEKLIKAIEGRG